MNKFLKSAVKRDKRKECLIAPLSKLDAEIIWELVIALGKLDIPDIKNILEEWKFLKDEEIRDMLLSWNISHPEGFKKSEGRKFVEFEDELIELALIRSVQRDNHYNYNTNVMEYRIVINKDFPEGISFPLADVYFSYPTSETREERLKKLKRVLNKHIKIV